MRFMGALAVGIASLAGPVQLTGQVGADSQRTVLQRALTAYRDSLWPQAILLFDSAATDSATALQGRFFGTLARIQLFIETQERVERLRDCAAARSLLQQAQELLPRLDSLPNGPGDPVPREEWVRQIPLRARDLVRRYCR